VRRKNHSENDTYFNLDWFNGRNISLFRLILHSIRTFG
jgi:hypothetical protein